MELSTVTCGYWGLAVATAARLPPATVGQIPSYRALVPARP